MATRNRLAAQTVLVIVAHPDDVEYLAAGTVAQWEKEGAEIGYCVVTDGESGWTGATPSDVSVGWLRREEQRAAAAVLGVSDVRFLGYPDGAVQVSPQLCRDLTRVVRSVRPDKVVMPSPEINWARIIDSHPDHRAVGEAALRVVYPEARNAFAHPELAENEGLSPWTVPECWLMGSPRPNWAIDVTDVFELKMDALRAHASQMPESDDFDDEIRSWLTGNAGQFALGVDRLAEIFQLVQTD